MAVDLMSNGSWLLLNYYFALEFWYSVIFTRVMLLRCLGGVAVIHNLWIS
jgi:hypothetical protein